jgi:myo-inositol-1(or 4)-monophosphatase
MSFVVASVPTEAWLRQVVLDAGTLTLQHFRKNLRQIQKPDHQGIVTEADLATEAFLKQTILDSYPDSRFLAEESTAADVWGPEGYSQEARRALGHRLLWIIDPIDGTTNFAKGNIHYCVSVAVGRFGTDGQWVTELGCVHQPATGDTYWARRGHGSWLNGQVLRVGPASPMASACFCTGFGYQTGHKLEQIIRASAALKDVSLGLRINGAAALDIAQTAAGRFDGFFEPRLMPWDIAAGAIIAQEAGLLVRTLKGEAYSVLDHSSVVVSHPDLLDSFLGIIQSHIH